MTEADVILQGLGDRAVVAVNRGVFVGMSSDLLALVDIGESRFPCDFGSGYIPTVGEPVQVLRIGSTNLLFPIGARPGEGTVLTVTAPLVKVQTSIGDFSMPFVGAAPTSGDRVAVIWSEGPKCLGKLSTTPTAPKPIPDPTPPATVQSATFNAINAGSTDRGSVRWWTDQPNAGNTSYGAWFYGTQIKDTIPAGAVFVSLEFFVHRTKDSGGAPRFTLHSDPFVSGIPAMSAYTDWDPAEGWQTPPDPAGWFAELKAGGSRYGVGLNQGGYNIFASLAQDRSSGALRISWRS